MEIISSLTNNRIKNFVKLKEKKYRDKEGMFLVEGLDLINEAKKNNLLDTVITTEDYDFNNIMLVTPEVMKKLSSLESNTNYIGIVKKREEKELFGRVLILDNIQDPGNLGTIIRSAVAFNIDTIVLSNDTVDLYNDKVIRSTKGMIFNTNIIKDDVIEVIKNLKAKDYLIIGTSLDNNTKLSEINLKKNIAIVVGNEGNGIKKGILDITDYNIKIDINSSCESLNVGVATGIVLYEINKVLK